MNKTMTVIGRVAAITGAVLLILLIMAYSVMWILVNGPSPTARRLFVLSVKETSAGGFLADIYLADEEISEILGSNGDDTPEEAVDVSLIQIPSETDSSVPSASDSENGEITDPGNGSEVGSADSGEAAANDDGIEIIDIEGSTYNGKLLIISDPKRIFVGVPDRYGADASGLTVAAMIEKYDCIAGTNAGGFYDPNGNGTGGIPDGIVIYEGKILWGNLYSSYNIAALDQNGILHVGTMTGQQAMDLGIEYAASYGPALVINGKACNENRTLGGGLNPRTVIGQRADGAILLLVINGRSLNSLGATYDDLVEIMLSYDAVNATNLDGGSSSIMIMDGEYLTSSAYIFGERVVATAILVK
ncbi:MAG: phosphodiester glycosidase family protein [Clostridia bacterium]|nr:phosphodiester glycosidase family protein [Clostridia bacterium]